MKTELQVVTLFFRKNGKLAGGSLRSFTGTEEEIRNAIDENGQLKGYIIEYMAHIAGVRNYDAVSVSADISEMTEEAEG